MHDKVTKKNVWPCIHGKDIWDEWLTLYIWQGHLEWMFDLVCIVRTFGKNVWPCIHGKDIWGECLTLYAWQGHLGWMFDLIYMAWTFGKNVWPWIWQGQLAWMFDLVYIASVHSKDICEECLNLYALSDSTSDEDCYPSTKFWPESYCFISTIHHIHPS